MKEEDRFWVYKYIMALCGGVAIAMLILIALLYDSSKYWIAGLPILDGILFITIFEIGFNIFTNKTKREKN